MKLIKLSEVGNLATHMRPAILQAWQTAFPPNHAGRNFWERPSVHNGFYQSYTANDFGKKIVRRVCELVSSHDWDWTKVCVRPAIDLLP